MQQPQPIQIVSPAMQTLNVSSSHARSATSAHLAAEGGSLPMMQCGRHWCPLKLHAAVDGHMHAACKKLLSIVLLGKTVCCCSCRMLPFPNSPGRLPRQHSVLALPCASLVLLETPQATHTSSQTRRSPWPAGLKAQSENHNVHCLAAVSASFSSCC